MSKDRQRYLLGRLFHSLFTLWVIVTISFMLFRMLPGDPAIAILGYQTSAEQRELLRERLGLDQPLLAQYGTYVSGLVLGDFGDSFATNTTVLGVVVPAFVNTMILAAGGTIISYGLGIVVGAILAWRRRSLLEHFGLGTVLALRSAPVFWTGMLVIFLFSFKLGWFPIGGMRIAGHEANHILINYLNWDFLKHAFLPLIVSSLYFMGVPTLLMRSSMLEVIGEDFIELMRAKGLSERVILFRHVVRNSILPVFTAATSHLGWAIGGLVTVEYVFSWPGVGRVLVDAVQTQDYLLAQGALLFIAITVLVINLFTDLLYGLIDPRVDLA